MFQLSQRQRDILIAAVSYAASNLDDINMIMADEELAATGVGLLVQGQRTPEFEQQELDDLLGLLIQDERADFWRIHAGAQEPRVIAYVEGGVLQGARASESLSFDVWDMDNQEASSGEELKPFAELKKEYEDLPFGVY